MRFTLNAHLLATFLRPRIAFTVLLSAFRFRLIRFQDFSFNVPMIVAERAPCESQPRKNDNASPTPVRLAPRTSSGEELANTISHCIGLIAAVIAAPVLLCAAWRSGTAGFFAGTIVFAATMFALYFVSMLYHAWPQTRAKQTLQMFDHCAIFLLIAGTYTPFSLGPLHAVWRSTILGYIWLLAIFGVIITP